MEKRNTRNREILQNYEGDYTMIWIIIVIVVLILLLLLPDGNGDEFNDTY